MKEFELEIENKECVIYIYYTNYLWVHEEDVVKGVLIL